MLQSGLYIFTPTVCMFLWVFYAVQRTAPNR